MSEQLEPLDLVVDLNTMDETGLPWAFLKPTVDPTRIVPGSHIVDDVVYVRPLRGPVSRHRHLLARRQAS